MAGYREFQTGEVLTAANVNSFLMEQATMTFADAAARDAALAGVLREGLLTYNLDEGRLEVYDGTDWIEPAPEPPAPPAGIGSNVVQTVKTDTFTTTSTSPTLITGLSVTITPSSDTSKVLLIATIPSSLSTADLSTFFLRFSGGNTSAYLGDASGNRQRAAASSGVNQASGTQYWRHYSAETESLLFVDSPATDSPVTYGVEAWVNVGTMFVNRTRFDFNSDRGPRLACTLIAIEVAA